MSKFGEPWTDTTECGADEIYNTDGERIYLEGFYRDSDVARTVACVNALAGVENPEAVKELVDIMRVNMEINVSIENGIPTLLDVKDALKPIFDAYRKIQFTEDESCEK